MTEMKQPRTIRLGTRKSKLAMAQTMMVFMLLPSHTIKIGARAVFGRLFSVIR